MNISLQQFKNNFKHSAQLFYFLCFFTLLFCFFEVCYFFQFNNFSLHDFSSAADHLNLPFGVVPPVLFFLLAQLFIHFFLVLYVWIQTVFLSVVFHWGKQTTEKIGFGLLGLIIATIFLANQFYYPNSHFAILPTSDFLNVIIQYSLYMVLGFLSITCLGCLCIVFKLFSFRYQCVITLLFVALAAQHVIHTYHISTADAATISRPNIIIIGVDSLRPDFLAYFSKKGNNTPNIDELLKQATVFSDSMTPLARTFPSWITILTGKYPKESNARTDLENIRHIDVSQTLPTILRAYGYHSIFATDETRFSNIDRKMGFDRIISPPIGFSDFILGALSDFPLSNLVVNSALGKKLFPYSYGNRPVAVTYDPDSFLAMLKPALLKSRSQPLFLAVHFCLAHSPYFWSEEQEQENQVDNYQQALHRVDQQVGDFLKILKQSHLLEHSIVILLSDHGEAIALHGDRVTKINYYQPTAKYGIPRFYPPSNDVELVDQSVGHGTDVLSLTQYRNLLAFKLYGLKENQVTAVSGRVSLFDIKPTLLNLLHAKKVESNGKVLTDAITGHKTHLELHSDLLTESDFSPQAVRTVHPEAKKVIFSGIDYFEVDPQTLHLHVKDSMEKMILASKQYADFSGDWVLALYPQKNHLMQPVLVNLKTEQWTCDLTSSFAKHSPASRMLQTIRSFYGNEIEGVIFATK